MAFSKVDSAIAMDPSERSALIRQGRQLEKEHARHVKRATLLLDANSRWKTVLNASERRDREYILLALQSEKVPARFGWGCFDYHCSNELKTDREIFLQRLELKSFEQHYQDCSYSKLPVPFRSDKEIMLKIVSKSSMTLSVASEELQNDRDVVMAALQNPHKNAPLSFQHVSKKMQNDKKIARTMLSHEYGITAFTILPRKMQHDYSLALFAVQSSSEQCNQSYEILSKLPEEMLDDYDIVYEAVQRRGSNLRFVESLLQDIDIVMAACENDGAAIEHVPKGPTRDELLEESNLIVLLNNGGHCILSELGDEYMMDSKYLIPAIKNGMILPEEFASKLFNEDHSLFMDVLRHSNQPFRQYDMLPDDIRGDATVGVAILKSEYLGEDSLARQFAADIPDDIARNHIDTLIKLAKNEYIPYSAGGDTGIWDEKAVAILLCKIDGDNLRRVSSRLQADAEVVKAALMDPKARVPISLIKKVPKEIFRSNHDLAALAVKAGRAETWPRGNSVPDLYQHLGKEAISSRVVFMEWVRKGWSVVYRDVNPFANDSIMARNAVKHAWHGNACNVLSNYSNRIRNNKEFMLSAIEANPELLHARCVPEHIAEDFDFLLRGISASRDLSSFSHVNRDFDLLSDFSSQVRERLSIVDGFIIEFLGAISMPPPSQKRPKRRRTGRPKCNLPILDLGHETGSGIFRTIAEFAGVPLGPDLKLLRSALENLKFWGY